MLGAHLERRGRAEPAQELKRGRLDPGKLNDDAQWKHDLTFKDTAKSVAEFLGA